MNEPTPELLALMEAEEGPSEDKLDRVRDQLRIARELELEISDLQERIKDKSEKLLEMKNKTLVDIFDEAGIHRLGLSPEGNAPAYEIEIKPYYKANIAADWESEKRKSAFAYLDKIGSGDLVKAIFTVSFGKGTRKQQQSLEAFLKKSKMNYSSDLGVPWQTLTAWVKDMIENQKKMPPLDVIGATVGRLASVVKQKKEKN